MQYWPRRRAQKRLPRMRSAPESGTPCICSIIAFKAGMTHVIMTDDSESAAKGAEISRSCTVLEIPETSVYGMRFYSKDPLSGYRSTAAEIIGVPSEGQGRKIDEDKLNKLKSRLGEFDDVTALIVAHPKSTPVGQHHPIRFESLVGGKSAEEKFNFISGLLGKRIGADAVFKSGEFIDVISISKGKGWQGVVKRFGIAKLWHKATAKRRRVGVLGPATPGKIFYTVAQSGQMGFNYRTEFNKRILKIGAAGDKSIVPSAGFTNYGVVKNGYIVVSGSVPGPSKRIVRIRKAMRGRGAIKEPKVSYISVR